jgi:Zn-dependent protease
VPSGWLVALGLGGSLLTHKLAHAVVARRAGLGVRRITLWLLGGVSELVGQPSEPGAEVRIALVGPVTSLGLGGLLGAAMVVGRELAAPTAVVATLSWLATMNILLGVFNLLPGTPLDGGRMLHGLLWRHTGNRDRATRAATTSGQVLGALLAGTGILLTAACTSSTIATVIIRPPYSGGAASVTGPTPATMRRSVATGA